MHNFGHMRTAHASAQTDQDLHFPLRESLHFESVSMYIKRHWIRLVDCPPPLTREKTSFLFAFLHTSFLQKKWCRPILSFEGIYSIRKEFAPEGANSFLIE